MRYVTVYKDLLASLLSAGQPVESAVKTGRNKAIPDHVLKSIGVAT